jgi:predicted alpha-1,2-mannosidase
MEKKIVLILALVALAGCSSSKAQKNKTRQPAHYVNVFIGTGGHGHTYPGATVPFGMVQVSPDNINHGWDWCSGYHYPDSSHPDSTLIGFAMTHLSGTGAHEGGDLLFMPFNIKGGHIDTTKGAIYSHYATKNQSGRPGYYSVKMTNGIQVELTASERVGFYRYQFPQSDRKSAVSLNLTHGLGDHPTGTYINQVNDTLITGYRFSSGAWVHHQRVYFAAVFNKPIRKLVITNDGKVYHSRKHVKGTRTHGYFIFGDLSGQPLLQKVGISDVSIKNAKMNLQQEVPGWKFEKVKKSAWKAWNKQLRKITVRSGDSSRLTTFYSALYHTMLAPTVYSDINGQYRGPVNQVHTASGFKAYSTFSLWDTYRAEQPLLTLIEPNRINGMVRFMLAFYDHHGLLPIWELYGNETYAMIGYSAVPVIADAYFKGFRGFDVQKAYKAMKKSATQQNKDVKLFNKYGYVPSDKATESVSKTLLYSFDDWCIAQMARALGKKDDYKTYSKRAENYKNIYNQKTGFMQPKLTDGRWLAPFDPYAEPSSDQKRNYTEANAWQDIWYVPQNVPELIDLMGGRQRFVARLDTLFHQSSKVIGGVADMSGMVGQYVQGNEPDMQTPYMYDYAGTPWKTQAITRLIVDSLYNDTPAGLPGNDDCGQMSAWYVLSAMGFYPVNPDNGTFEIGSPIFPKTTIHLKGNKTFTVVARNVSKKNKYIQSATLNGKTYNKPYITYADITEGATLQFKMGPTPNKKWGAAKAYQPPIMVFNGNQ